jgi:hypothetical protein
MKIVKYIAVRIVLAAVFLFSMNLLYRYTFWKEDVKQHGDVLENLWGVDIHSDAIYFGESSNFHMQEGDSIKHRISFALDSLLPSISIATVDNAGLHAGTYLSLVKNIPSEMKLKFILVTLNYRSFAANWRYAPFENYLSKSELMLSPSFPLVNKFLISLKQYDYKTEEERNAQMKLAWKNEKFTIPNFDYDNVIEWDSAVAWHTWLDVNPNLTEENLSLASHYIKNFAFNIDTVYNERIEDLNAIVAIANDKGYKLIFNLLGENAIEAEKLVGKELLYLMENNRSLLVNYYTNKGVIMVDNFYQIPDSCFVDRNWPTEHYNYQGKKIVAENIKKAIETNGLHY